MFPDLPTNNPYVTTVSLQVLHPLSQLHPESFTSLLKSNMISTFGIATLNKVNGCRFHLKMSLKKPQVLVIFLPLPQRYLLPKSSLCSTKVTPFPGSFMAFADPSHLPTGMQQRNTLGFGYNFSIGICQLLQAPVNFGQKCNKTVMASANAVFSCQGW